MKTKKMLDVTFSDREIDFIGNALVDLAIDAPVSEILIAAAQQIDADGKTAFTPALSLGGPGHTPASIEFDATQGTTRVIVFNNDRGTMPVVVLVREIIEWA